MSALLRLPVSPRAALAIIALALCVSLVGGREAQQPAPPAAPQPPTPPADLDLAPLQRVRLGEPAADPFARRAAVSAKHAAPATQPPAAPKAPPLPFRYLGRIVDAGRSTIFLAHGEEHFAAEPGALLAGQYQVEQVDATAITFVYLPLGTRHTLPLPATE